MPSAFAQSVILRAPKIIDWVSHFYHLRTLEKARIERQCKICHCGLLLSCESIHFAALRSQFVVLASLGFLDSRDKGLLHVP